MKFRKSERKTKVRKMLSYTALENNLVLERIDGVIQHLEEEIGNQNWQSAHRYAIMLKYFTEIENAAKEKLS